MDTKKLNEAIARLAELDPADVPDAADQIAEALAAQLELSDEPEGDPAG
jgi:DNA-directed RNA polymerase specialized sigma54-like protein